jgi:hypothetical protein
MAAIPLINRAGRAKGGVRVSGLDTGVGVVDFVHQRTTRNIHGLSGYQKRFDAKALPEPV